MQIIQQRFSGKLFVEGLRSAAWLVLSRNSAEISPITPVPVYLRYALTLRDSEAPFFPTLLLDDWGTEIRRLKLYSWLRENGDFFPRSELFGYTADGKEHQCFVREIERFRPFEPYIATQKTASAQESHRLHAVLIPTRGLEMAQSIACPKPIQRPLKRAKLAWWRIPPHQLSDFNYKKMVQKSSDI